MASLLQRAKALLETPPRDESLEFDSRYHDAKVFELCIALAVAVAFPIYRMLADRLVFKVRAGAAGERGWAGGARGGEGGPARRGERREAGGAVGQRAGGREVPGGGAGVWGGGSQGGVGDSRASVR